MWRPLGSCPVCPVLSPALIPVPKKPVISCMNDLRPIALTSVPMKVCERLVLNDLKVKVAPHLDPMQFAYQQNRNTEDAIITLLELMYSHLERTRFGNSARVIVVCMRGKCSTKCTMLKDRDYDVTPRIILILSLIFAPNAPGVGEGLRGVLWRWLIVGVVGVRSRWVGDGDPLEN